MKLSLLCLAAVVGLLWLAWGWPSAAHADGPDSVGLAPASTAPLAEEEDVELLAPGAAVGGVAAASVGEREAALVEAPSNGGRRASTVQCPPRFSRLNLRVTDGTRPLEGAVISLDDNVDHLFDAPTDKDGAARTDAEGRVSVFARGSRIVTVHATAPGPGATSIVRGITTPVDGRERTVEILLKSQDAVEAKEGVELLVLSVRGRVPVEGVRVEYGEAGSQGKAYVTSGPDGRVFVPCGASRWLRLVKAGYGSSESKAPELVKGAVWTVYLTPHTHVFGRVAGLGAEPKRQRKPYVQLFYLDDLNDPNPALREALQRTPMFRVDVQEDGSWAFDSFVMFRTKDWQPQSASVFLYDGPMVRQLAIIDPVLPGDQHEVTDPWAGGAPLEIRFVTAEGEPAAPEGALTLTYEGGLKATWRAKAEHPSVNLGVAGLGRWGYRIDYPHVMGARENAVFDGHFNHQGTEPVTIVLDGNVLRGTVTWAMKDHPRGVAVKLVPRSFGAQSDSTAAGSTHPTPTAQDDPWRNIVVRTVTRSDGQPRSRSGIDHILGPDADGNMTMPFTIRGVPQEGEWDLLVVSKTTFNEGAAAFLERVAVDPDLATIDIVVPKER